MRGPVLVMEALLVVSGMVLLLNVHVCSTIIIVYLIT